MSLFPRLLTVSAFVVAALLAAGPAAAQYPSKPIRLIVPFPAGGSTDTIARAIAQPLSAALGQQMVVDNRPGADGAIAADAVLKSAPDGYTLFMATSSALSAVPTMRKQPPYDPVTAFTPIGKVGTYTYFMFAHPSLPGRTVGEVIQYIRANPGKVKYAGATTAGVMAAVEMSGFAKLDMVRIPYKGEGAATLDLVSGRVQLMFATPTNAMPAAKDGRLKLLAALLPQRSPLSPETPTMSEAGAPNLSIVPWGGFFGPAGLPPEIVARLNRELNIVLARPDVRAQLVQQAFEVQSSTAAELGVHVKTQLDLWRKAVLESGLTLE